MNKLFKNKYFKLGLILGLFIIAVLIVLPRTPVVFPPLGLNTEIGGYYLARTDGSFELDLREFKKGLDLNGGIRIVLEADMSKIDPLDRDSAIDSAREIIERRVNYLGVAEPYIAPVRAGDDYRLIVEIPGVTDIAAALELVGRTAQISFKQLKPEIEYNRDQYIEIISNPENWEDSGITGADIRGANVVFSQAVGTAGQPTGTPQIQLQFTNDGREKFSELAKANITKPIGIFLDDIEFPLSAPHVSEEFANGVYQDPVITGSFGVDEANALAVQIKAGALPIPVKVLSQEQVGATLGESSVAASYKAGLAGFLLILVFMLFMYRRLGIVADIALIMYGVFVLAIFKLIPVVLTLPGIAGFLLSIGMAVDANILIYERIREELAAGKPRSLAVKNGFEKAWSSIRDSNVSSIIAALILMYLGSGPVRGFAITLLIGILVSLFTAIFIVRVLISVVGLDKNNSRIQSIINKVKKRKEVSDL